LFISTPERENAPFVISVSVILKGISFLDGEFDKAGRAVLDSVGKVVFSLYSNEDKASEKICLASVLSSGEADEEVKGAVESLYLQAVVDEGQSMKIRLQAAQQWQKLRGLEKQKEVVQEDEDMSFFKACMKRARESQKNVIDISAE
jgi:hypothetical protein